MEKKDEICLNLTNQDIKDILTCLSRDIRMPLNAIVGLVALAENNIGNDEKIRENLANISVSCKNLLSTVTGLIDLARFGSGEAMLQEENFNLQELACDIAKTTQELLLEKEQTFTPDMSLVVHKDVYGDAVRLKQLIMNIISTASELSPRMSHFDIEVREESFDKEHGLCLFIQVIDEKNNLPEDLMEEINDLKLNDFSSLNATSIMGGTLGLPVAMNVVHMMEGHIEVTSEFGKGTKYSAKFYLKPAKEASETQISDIQTLKKNKYRGKKILLAEDNDITREMICEILELTGVSVDAVEDGSLALDAFAKSKLFYYDLVFMDINMPNMDGLDTTAAIRSLQREDAHIVPIVAMTANAFPDDIKRSKECGMNEHMVKPIDFDELDAVLENWLS